LTPFRRVTEPGIGLDEIPHVDLVILSHNHYDHLDVKTVKLLQQKYPNVQWIVPAGVASWFRKRHIMHVKELRWWEGMATSEYCVEAVPAQHFSGRSLWDQNTTHWNGYVLQRHGKTLYFAGDTGYNSSDFRDIGRKFAPIDLSLIPIGAYSPSRFMEPVHVNPYQAVAIHFDVGSRLSLGMHWNTFALSDEPRGRPPYDLYLAMLERQAPFETFLPVDPGVEVPW
jgi:N-acyl-phosphatidylethanolamine-hydrolysing phospholipase D